MGPVGGRYLDLEPYWRRIGLGSPPKCAGNGFVIFKSDLTSEEKAILSEYVATDEYQALHKLHEPNYLASRMQRKLGEPLRQIARSLLQATWHARRRKPDFYRPYAIETLDAYNQLLAEPYGRRTDWLRDNFVAGELERRLGQFAEARTRFEGLRKEPEIETGPFPVMLEMQLKLIGEKNSSTQKIPGNVSTDVVLFLH
jgi:hypothetical protein